MAILHQKNSRKRPFYHFIWGISAQFLIRFSKAYYGNYTSLRHDSFLAAKRNGACSSYISLSNSKNYSPDIYWKRPSWRQKNSLIRFLASREFPAGLWMVVVDGFITAMKIHLIHDNSSFPRYNLIYHAGYVIYISQASIRAQPGFSSFNRLEVMVIWKRHV